MKITPTINGNAMELGAIGEVVFLDLVRAAAARVYVIVTLRLTGRVTWHCGATGVTTI